MTTWKAGGDAYFELAFSPCISLVSTVRRFVSDFYNQVLGDPDLTSRIAVATHELLENSARYAVDGQTSIRIGVRRDAEAFAVEILTKNRASPEDTETLRKMLDEIAAAADPSAHYIDLMRRTAKRTDGSGLGLGRVRAETDMHLSYEIVDGVVALRAEARIETGDSK